MHAPFHAIKLRPGIANPNEWQSSDRKRAVPEKLRKAILTRDDYTCASCGHRALKWMNIHHLADAESDNPDNLCTLCVACHAVMHMGFNLQHGHVEIWKSPISQVELVQLTRKGVRSGRTLEEINASFNLRKGRRAPSSVEWANELLHNMGPEPRAELPEPLCAVFVRFERWQVEA